MKRLALNRSVSNQHRPNIYAGLAEGWVGSRVFVAYSPWTGGVYFAKLQPIHDDSTLAREVQLLKRCALDNQRELVPQIIWEGMELGFRALVIPYYSFDLGKFILEAPKELGRKARVTKVARFACEMVR